MNPDKSRSSSFSSTIGSSSSVFFFLISTSNTPVTAVPANSAISAAIGFDIAGITNTPPDGTLLPTSRLKLIAPVTPHPVAVQITVRMISFIAIGITPSEIMQRPIGNATLIFSFSCAV